MRASDVYGIPMYAMNSILLHINYILTSEKHRTSSFIWCICARCVLPLLRDDRMHDKMECAHTGWGERDFSSALCFTDKTGWCVGVCVCGTHFLSFFLRLCASASTTNKMRQPLLSRVDALHSQILFDVRQMWTCAADSSNRAPGKICKFNMMNRARHSQMTQIRYDFDPIEKVVRTNGDAGQNRHQQT